MSAFRTPRIRRRRSIRRRACDCCASAAGRRTFSQAILGHATYTDVARETRMARALFAVDELTGLITATALVKPTKSVHDVDARSVRKKMKDKAFAKGVNRDDVMLGVQELGVDLDQHIQFVIDAMRRAADCARARRDAGGRRARPRPTRAREAAALTINVSRSGPSVNESGHRQRFDDRCDHNRTAVRHAVSQHDAKSDERALVDRGAEGLERSLRAARARASASGVRRVSRDRAHARGRGGRGSGGVPPCLPGAGPFPSRSTVRRVAVPHHGQCVAGPGAAAESPRRGRTAGDGSHAVPGSGRIG